MSVRSSRIAALAVMLIAMPICAASGPAPEQASRSVVLADVDLATPDGIATARARVEDAAVRLCRQFQDSRRISTRETFKECVRETRQMAWNRLEQRAPIAVAATHEIAAAH